MKRIAKRKPLTFEDALRRVMQVSKQDIERLQGNKEAMEWVKEKRGPKPRANAQEGAREAPSCSKHSVLARRASQSHPSGD